MFDIPQTSDHYGRSTTQYLSSQTWHGTRRAGPEPSLSVQVTTLVIHSLAVTLADCHVHAQAIPCSGPMELPPLTAFAYQVLRATPLERWLSHLLRIWLPSLSAATYRCVFDIQSPTNWKAASNVHSAASPPPPYRDNGRTSILEVRVTFSVCPMPTTNLEAI
ncbi:hypothetical protein CCMA1212_004848 [Trichoderma ghanense]|uniref:Uncharacterized protein n=1 Tax=Trichoderma ghanense TaxID=65468 RepID=A0ABY2H4R9_9HYPO